MTRVMTEVPSKREFALSLLEECPSVFVHLDARREGVFVPSQFQKQAQLILQVGYRMPVPIPDLEVDENGIHCTLSFGGRAQFCRMPWSAVFALVGENRRALVWPQDVPPEVVAQQNASRTRAGSHLRAVGGGSSTEDSTAEAAEAAAQEGAGDPDHQEQAKGSGRAVEVGRRASAPAGAPPGAAAEGAAREGSGGSDSTRSAEEPAVFAHPAAAQRRARLSAVGQPPEPEEPEPAVDSPEGGEAPVPGPAAGPSSEAPTPSKRPPYLRLVK